MMYEPESIMVSSALEVKIFTGLTIAPMMPGFLRESTVNENWAEGNAEVTIFWITIVRAVALATQVRLAELKLPAMQATFVFT